MARKRQDDKHQQPQEEPEAAKESESTEQESISDAQESPPAKPEDHSPDAKTMVQSANDSETPNGSEAEGKDSENPDSSEAEGNDPENPDSSTETAEPEPSASEGRADQTKCPRCGRYGCPAQRTAGDVQYRKCQHCGFTFKTARIADGRFEFRG